MDLIQKFLRQYDHPDTKRAYELDLRSLTKTHSVTPQNVAAVFNAESIHARFEKFASRGSQGTAMLRRKRAVLRSFLRWIQRHNFADVSHILSSLNHVRAGMADDRRSHVPLGLSDLNSLLRATKAGGAGAVRDRAVILILYYCCIRRSELVRMNLEHICTYNSETFIDIPNTESRSAVFVRIPYEPLRAVQEVVKTYGILSGPIWRSMSNNSAGKRLSPRSVHAIVSRAASRAGLDDTINANTLRLAGLVHTLSIPAIGIDASTWNLANPRKPWIFSGAHGD